MASVRARSLRVVDVVKRSTHLARLRRQSYEVLTQGKGSAVRWSQERVASLLGMSTTTYADRESAANRSGRSASQVDVDTLAALAYVLGTYPAVLLLPDDDMLQAGAEVEVQSTLGASLGTFSVNDYGLWILGLGALPGQLGGYFDLSGRVSLAEFRAKTARGVGAATMDPWDVQQGLRPWDEGEDFSSRSDIELGLRVMSACREYMFLASLREGVDAGESDLLEQDIIDTLGRVADILEELGARMSSRRRGA